MKKLVSCIELVVQVLNLMLVANRWKEVYRDIVTSSMLTSPVKITHHFLIHHPKRDINTGSWKIYVKVLDNFVWLDIALMLVCNSYVSWAPFFRCIQNR